MQPDIADYRNGKYQGPINNHKQRHGLGIFIDDDLAFHISHWQSNKLNGPTLIYLTHGKYMYGEWRQNQPHGLNIYRSGDTVLLSKFNQGLPSQQCLLIFQRYNFACVLIEKEGQWQVSQSGPLPSHKILLDYIAKVGLAVPDHYFSLTKFACSYSANNKFIKTFPCLTNYCYFGFINGLGIIFNSNNGVVSVGYHCNEVLCQFGGRFDGTKNAEQGNFEDGGERISYKGVRPASQISSIFQNLHKKGMNFYNQYFDSKSKVLSNIERMLRGKLKDIAEKGMQLHLLNKNSLNDSLDFHEYDQEESIKNHQNRQKMYSPPKKSMDRSKSKLHLNSSIIQLSRDKNSSSKTIETAALLPAKRQNQENLMNFGDHLKIDRNKSPFREQTNKYQHFAQKIPQKMVQRNRSPYQYKPLQSQTKQIQSRKPSVTEFIVENEPKQSKREDLKKDLPLFEELKLVSEFSRKAYHQKLTDHIESNFTKKKQESSGQLSQPSPTFKGLIDQIQNKYRLCKKVLDEKPVELSKSKKEGKIRKKEIQNSQKCSPNKEIQRKGKKFDLQTLPKPSYEEIEQRRKRILRQFKELNQELSEEPAGSAIEKNQQELQQGQRKSSVESSFGYLPLTITDKKRKHNMTPQKQNEGYEEQLRSRNGTQKRITTQPASLISTPMKEKVNNSKHQLAPLLKSFQQIITESALEKKSKAEEITKLSKGGQLSKLIDSEVRNSSQQVSISPSRQKKTYVYLFQ